ncbi:MAG: hypothetical protein L0H54_12800 [Alcaligenaceae bacterium]|nr:hypothetical protein [Alcaligenaceae bacterium]
MRERLDCAVLMVGEGAWAKGLLGSHAGGRLHMHGLRIEAGGLESVLHGRSAGLRRYDACLMHADEPGLAGLRRTLVALPARPGAFLIAYAQDLKAAAIHDLYALGVDEFIRAPFCADALRARLERLLDTRRDRILEPGLMVAEGGPDYLAQGVGEDELCDTILQRSGTELEAYAVAFASRGATSRESFRSAKGKVVARFEKAYIHAALGRHGGNIAMAARAAQKHRRAFWELMRKHDIDPDPYRRASAPDYPPDG